MRISNKVCGKEGRDDKGQPMHICKLCSNSVREGGACSQQGSKQGAASLWLLAVAGKQQSPMTEPPIASTGWLCCGPCSPLASSARAVRQQAASLGTAQLPSWQEVAEATPTSGQVRLCMGTSAQLSCAEAPATSLMQSCQLQTSTRMDLHAQALAYRPACTHT